ncbi:hypothetical protein KA005_85230 [bacterium]|nr:hypothetical protein [bacterium]
MNSFEELYISARTCNRCYPGKEICVPQPDTKNASGKADILFVAERPGRNGAGKTGVISFDNDDPTADFFRECFELSGLSRKEIFITNACLCFPVFEGYADKKPSISEIKNCHYWFKKVLNLADPKLIVTVGSSALDSVLRYFNHKLSTNFLQIVGTLITETNPSIYPIAHTSRRGRINRSGDLQKEDWLKIPKIIESQ